jgi:hypothetical protein
VVEEGNGVTIPPSDRRLDRHAADQDTDSDVVTKVLKTAGYAGFVNVRFGVIAQ